jgi:hypothetical protein
MEWNRVDRGSMKYRYRCGLMSLAKAPRLALAIKEKGAILLRLPGAMVARLASIANGTKRLQVRVLRWSFFFLVGCCTSYFLDAYGLVLFFEYERCSQKLWLSYLSYMYTFAT